MGTPPLRLSEHHRTAVAASIYRVSMKLLDR